MYVGECGGARVTERLARLGWGRMWSFRNPTPGDGEPFALDNGAFRAWSSGDEWDGGRYAAYVQRVVDAGIKPTIVALPDVLGEPVETVRRSWQWLDRYPLDWPLYLVLQDGVREEAVQHFAPLLRGVFLGGTDRFKADAGKWCAWAHERGLRFHYGRAGGFARLQHAIDIGANSLDGTAMMWVADRWTRYEEWWNRGTPEQPRFPQFERVADA